ncbi:unnamed protein product [Callosobruchus maculatus]|uniref:C2H2-type domain-containing protein n=1 Tax=Callosobruchus maculatus TaxID=64391 RepID=A0A653BSF6_CALMS|nr:unnamed protein product [Callosobruchus maculatus]
MECITKQLYYFWMILPSINQLEHLSFFLTSHFVIVMYQCYQCLKTYRRSDSLKRHIRLECNKPALHPCENCGKSYKWHASLVRHLKYECNKEGIWPCDICDRTFKHRFNLVTHLKTHSRLELWSIRK